MADKKVSQLTALTGANTASGDLLYIVDISEPVAADQSKKITLTEFQSAPISAGTANGVAFLDGSKVLTTGSALTFDGSIVSNTGVGFNVNNANALYRFQNGSGTRTGYFQVRADAFEVWSDQAAVPMVFGTSNAEQMRLTSTGLGIGTSSPSNKLVVSNAGANGLEVNPTSGVSSGASLNGYNRSTLAFTPLTYVALDHYFQVGSSPVTAATLDSSGNLGLGVTPSAWNLSGLQALQIKNAGFYGFGTNEVGVVGNCFYDTGVGGWKYISTDVATRYRQRDGSHLWFNAPSGTAGDAISFTQAMTLDASGNLLVGTTSVAYSAAGRGLVEINGTSESLLALKRNNTNNFYIHNTSTATSIVSAGLLTFSTNSGVAEAARITSGGNLDLQNNIGLGGASATTSGTGITFPATQSASSNANTLDDYEEGTWTPVDSGGMTGFTAINGTYVKIGNLVHVRGAFSMTSVTTNIFISGLPFASATTYYSVVYSGIAVAIAFARVEAASQIQWNVNATGGGNQTVDFTAWYQV